MTKEQLIQLNAELTEQNKRFKTEQEGLRLSMCKVLGFVSTDRSYGISTREVTDLSWPEIYAEIGRLRELARQKDQSEQLRYFEELINRHDHQLSEINKGTLDTI